MAPKTASKKASSRQVLAAAYKKSEAEEAREERASCLPVTLRSVRAFVAVFSVLLFARAFLAFHSDAVLPSIQRRFASSLSRMQFVVGVEKIGFVLTLIFIAYYGRNLHKPVAMLSGAVLCCLSAVLCFLPYFVCEPLDPGSDHNVTTPMMRYLDAGLCQSGRNVSYEFSHNQCDQIRQVADETKAFSLLCFGKFLIGVGTACYVTIGVVYLSESADENATPLLLGQCIICRSHSLVF
jgi:MFS family permease